MVKIYKQPFAYDGDAIAVPDASQPDGKMSSVDGWTPDYQLPKTDPNYKPVGRQEMNGVFKEVTEALGQVQVQGAASWSVDGAPYPINAQVYHNGKQWLALRANSVEPVDGEDWRELLFGNLVPASEAIRGVIQLATAAEAQALLNDANALTPAKLAAAFGGANQGLAASGYQRLPGGLIIQWGRKQGPASGNTDTIVYPLAFPNGALFGTFALETTAGAAAAYRVTPNANNVEAEISISPAGFAGVIFYRYFFIGY